MKTYPILVAAIAHLIMANALAGAIETTDTAKDWTWVASISAGPIWADAGATQTFYLTQHIEKTYAANQTSNSLPSGELFAGIQKVLPHQLLGQFGLAVATTGNARLQGTIWDDADPRFANYSYQYKVQSTHIAAKGKLLLNQNYWVMPWISASLGIGFNRAYAFNNTPLIFEALPNNNFSNHTETAFTYTLGAGLQKALTPHCQIGVGYEFSDWGQNHLGRAAGQTVNYGLALNHLYTNGVMFNLTYLV